jgi:hypothetical protein
MAALDLSPFKVKADIMWACLDTPNSVSERYEVNLCNLSNEAIKRFEQAGIPVKKKEGQGFYVVAKSKNYPIPAIDSDGGAITCKVGNGSKGVAIVNPYKYTFRGKDGVSAGIKKLIVTDLIEYNVGAEADAEEESLEAL